VSVVVRAEELELGSDLEQRIVIDLVFDQRFGHLVLDHRLAYLFD
jgi:hypothetical protein